MCVQPVVVCCCLLFIVVVNLLVVCTGDSLVGTSPSEEVLEMEMEENNEIFLECNLVIQANLAIVNTKNPTLLHLSCIKRHARGFYVKATHLMLVFDAEYYVWL